MTNIFWSLLILFPLLSFGSTSISLSECQALARENFPLIKQMDIIEKSRDYTLGNATKGYLPQINLNAQANYLSDVTSLPISSPMFSVEPISKDQYKIYGELYQPLTNFYHINKSKKETRLEAELNKKESEIEFYKLKERVNGIYFGILTITAQIAQSDYLTKDLKVGVQNIEVSLNNGMASENDLDMIQAELLNVEQKIIEWKTLREGYVDMLSQLIGKSLDSMVELKAPEAPNSSKTAQRPEQQMFDVKHELIESKKDLINAKLIPQAGIFLQGGYGRPGLNMLNDDFDIYYVVGAKLSWNLQPFYTSGSNKRLLELSQKSLEVQRQIFDYNIEFQTRQQNSEIQKFQNLLSKDLEIIELRKTIKNRAQLQLKNGVLSANDYIRFVNDEDKARQAKIIHDIQLLAAQFQYQITTGGASE